jgi:SNF2 family DNA or RNA helicase
MDCFSDEASHKIKNANSHSARACSALFGHFRWAMTATPIVRCPEYSCLHRMTRTKHNTINDLYSLLKFLRVKPYCDPMWFKENISIPLDKGKNADVAINMLRVCILWLLKLKLTWATARSWKNHDPSTQESEDQRKEDCRVAPEAFHLHLIDVERCRAEVLWRT